MLLWARAAIVSSILLFVPYMLEQFDHPKAVAVRVLGGGALAAAAAALGRRRNGQAPRWVPLDGALLAWLVVEVAATIASRAPHLSVWGDYEQHEGLLTSVGVFGIYAAARLGTRSPADAERTLRWLVGAAAVSGAYALLVQASGLDQLVWTRTALYSEGRFVRPFGTMGHPNLLGVTTAASLAIAVSMTVLARRGRPWWVGAAILLGVVTGVTLSRGAWLGGAAGVLVARWATVRADAEPGRNRRLLAMIGLASLLAAVVVATVPIFRNRFFELLTPTSGPSRSRLEIWKTALAMWRAHPWLGVGPDAFMLLFERYQTAAFWRLEWATIHFHAHSIYLHTLATRGLAGLAVSLAAAVALGHGLWAGWRRGLPVRAAVAPILAALTAVAVAGAFGVLGNAGAAEVAALLGTAAALAATPVTVATDVATVESATEERRPARVRRPRSRRRVTGSPVTPTRWGTPGWIGAAVALLAMIPQLGGLLGSRAAAYGRDFVSSVSVDGGTAQRMLDRAVRLDPGNDYIWKIRANTYLTLVAGADRPGATPPPAAVIRSLLGEAERSARRAAALMPLRASNQAVLGNTWLARARHGEPERIAEGVAAYRRCWELGPYSALTLDQFSYQMSALGRPDLAIGPARRAAALYPDEGLTESILGGVSMRLGDTTTAIRAFHRALAGNWRSALVDRELVEQTLSQMEAARVHGPDLTPR